MYNLPQAEVNKYLNNTRTFKAKIELNGNKTLYDSDIVSFSIENSIGESSILSIGSTCSNSLKLTYLRGNDAPETISTTQPIKPYVAIEISNGIYSDWLPLGVFFADSETIEKDKMTVSFTCYDKMKQLDSLIYTSSLTFPASIESVLAEICSKTSLTIAEDSLEIPSFWRWLKKPEKLSYRIVISEIAELIASSATIDRNGKLKFVKPTEQALSITAEDYIDFKETANETMNICKLEVQKDNETNLKAGSGTGTCLTFSNENILTTAELESVYNKLFPFVYQPFEMNLKGLPFVDCGDIVSVTTTEGKTYKVPVISSTLTYAGSLKSQFKALGARSSVNVGTTGEGSLTQAIEALKVEQLQVGEAIIDKADIDLANVKDLSVTGNLIANGAITTNKLSAKAVKASKIDVDDLFAQNINATGTITGAKLTTAEDKGKQSFEVSASGGLQVYNRKNSGVISFSGVNKDSGALFEPTVTMNYLGVTASASPNNTVNSEQEEVRLSCDTTIKGKSKQYNPSISFIRTGRVGTLSTIVREGYYINHDGIFLATSDSSGAMDSNKQIVAIDYYTGNGRFITKAPLFVEDSLRVEGASGMSVEKTINDTLYANRVYITTRNSGANISGYTGLYDYTAKSWKSYWRYDESSMYASTGITVNGTLTANANIVPNTDAGSTLGTSSKRFSHTYTNAITGNNTLLLSSNSDSQPIIAIGSSLTTNNKARTGYVPMKASKFEVVSSKHLKTNIEPITTEEAEKVLQLNPVSFDYINEDKDKRGLIAEEVMKVFPQCVSIPEGYNEDSFIYDDSKTFCENASNVPSIDYSSFVPYLIKMIQIQQAEIEELKERIGK